METPVIFFIISQGLGFGFLVFFFFFSSTPRSFLLRMGVGNFTLRDPGV